jgi:hypothetical protein
MYLIDMEDQNRESESIRHLLSGPLHEQYLLNPMGLASFSWILIEVDNIHLVPSIKGEVDILAGPLQFRVPEDLQRVLKRQRSERPDRHPYWHEVLAAKEVSEAGGILWPPALSYVVGVEVKCAYFSDRLHATKDSKSHVNDIRKQVNRLGRMGFDRMALLDVIANLPNGGVNSNAWLEAGGRAQDSLEKMKNILDVRLPHGTPAAQFIWSVGAVIGGDESDRGAGAPKMLRRGLLNPALAARNAKVLANREVLLARMSQILKGLPQPTYFPAIFAGCRVCKKIRRFEDSECACARRSSLN